MSLLREKNPFAHFPVTFSGWGLTHFGHAATLYTHVCPLSLCSEFQKVPMPQSWFEKQDKDRSYRVRACWSCKEFRFHSRANRRQTTLVAEQRMERQVGDDGSLGQVTPLLLYPPGPPRNASQPLISSLLICRTELAMVSSS